MTHSSNFDSCLRRFLLLTINAGLFSWSPLNIIYLQRFFFFFTLSSFLEPLLTLIQLSLFPWLLSPEIPFSSSLESFPMATSSQSTKIPPTQAALNKMIVEKYRRQCDIPSEFFLEVLGPQYENWRTNLSILPHVSIVISNLHLQNLWLHFNFSITFLLSMTFIHSKYPLIP